MTIIVSNCLHYNRFIFLLNESLLGQYKSIIYMNVTVKENESG